MLIDLVILTSRATVIRRIIKVLVKDALQGAVDASLQVLTLDEEGGVLKCPNSDRPAKLKVRPLL